MRELIDVGCNKLHHITPRGGDGYSVAMSTLLMAQFIAPYGLRDFTQDDLKKICDVYHAWQTGQDYADQKGFCASADLADIQKHDYVLTPGRYVGAEEIENDGEAFAEKMARLTKQLKAQFEESDRLEAEIEKNLAGVGYGI